LGIPVKLSETPGRLRKSPPGFGANTNQILGELGYSKAEIDKLREESVV
jgi:formyl-CoA transferase/CoA:oxalate CoA-transferase